MDNEKKMQTQNTEEIDLKELFLVLWSKIWILIAAAVGGAVIAALYTILCVTPMYESTSSLYILSKTTTLTSLTDLQLGSQLTQDYMVLAKSRNVVEDVIKELELDMTYEQFLDTVTITNESNTRILNLSVKNSDPYMAKTIVDKYAEVTARKTADVMATEVPNVVDKGVVAENPVSPNTKKNIVLGGLIFFVVAAGVIIVRYLLDDSIKTADDAEKYLGLTNLGSIPVYTGDKKGKKSKKSKKSSKSTMKKSA